MAKKSVKMKPIEKTPVRKRAPRVLSRTKRVGTPKIRTTRLSFEEVWKLISNLVGYANLLSDRELPENLRRRYTPLFQDLKELLISYQKVLVDDVDRIAICYIVENLYFSYSALLAGNLSDFENAKRAAIHYITPVAGYLKSHGCLTSNWENFEERIDQLYCSKDEIERCALEIGGTKEFVIMKVAGFLGRGESTIRSEFKITGNITESETILNHFAFPNFTDLMKSARVPEGVSGGIGIAIKDIIRKEFKKSLST